MKDHFALRRMMAAGMLMLCLAAAAPAQSQKARLRVLLPATDVKLEIMGLPLPEKKGVEIRLFESPPLEPGKTFIYDIKATWMENGKPVTRERSVRVMAGKTSEVNLRLAVDTSPDVEQPKPITPEKAAPEKSVPEKPIGARPPEPSFVATPPEIVDMILQLAKVREGDVVFDLGCADGRISLAAVSKFKARKAVGVDANADRLANARKNADKLIDKVDYRLGDPAKVTDKELADATVVTLDNMNEKHMADLVTVLKKLKAGTRIVAHSFEIAGMKHDDKKAVLIKDVEYIAYLYTVK